MTGHGVMPYLRSILAGPNRGWLWPFMTLVLLWVWPVHEVRAADPGRLRGRVVEAGLDDFGVEGALVSVEDTDLFSLTDPDGNFVIDEVPGGALVVLVDAQDYESARVVVEDAARAGDLRIELVFEGAGVQVTTASVAPRAPTASTTQLSARQMAAAPRRNAEEILRQVPGLTLVQHGSEGKGHQFFLRGFDAIHGADLELTFDGIPINEWSNIHAQGYLDLGLILPEMLRTVEVTKGPFTLRQGAFGMAGSADYQLGVPGEDQGWRAAYTIGTTNRHRVFLGWAPVDSSGDQFVGVEATHDDSFGQNRQLDRATVNAKARVFESASAGKLDVLALGNWSEFGLPGALRNDDVAAGRIGFYDTYEPRARGESARALLALTYQHTADADGSAPPASDLAVTMYGGYRYLDLRENFTGFLVDPLNGDLRNQSQQAWSFGVFATHRARLVERLGLLTGLGVRGDVFAQFEDYLGQQLERISRRRDLDATQVDIHGLAGLRWTPVDALQVDAGARLDVVHVDTLDQLADGARDGGTLLLASPRMTARWQALDFWQLFAAYGRGYRPPEARAFSRFKPEQTGIGEEIYTGGEPAMTVSDAFELGTRWDPRDWFGVSVAGFATFIARESIFDHVSGINLELNGTRRLGAELVVYSDPLHWLNLQGDLTLVDARFVASQNPVPLAPWLTSGLRATVTHPSGLRAGVRTLLVAPRTLPHGARGATLLMSDATLGYHWRWVRVDLEVENLLNRQLREGEYHYASYWPLGGAVSEIPVLTTTAGPPLNARLTLGVVF